MADCGVSASRMRVRASTLRARGTSYDDCRTCGTVICLPAIVIRCGSRMIAGGEIGDARRDGGREERRLPLGRRLGQDPLDVLDEAHVEHLVRLVEDEEADVVELERAPPHVVHDAAGRADHDLDAALQAAELPLVGLAAVDGQRLHVLVAAVLVQRLRDLDRQLARRGQNERLHRAQLGVDRLDDGQAERGRLAGAGLRLGDDVLPAQEERDGCDLDRRRRFVADVLDRLQQRGADPQVLKGRAAVALCLRRGRTPIAQLPPQRRRRFRQCRARDSPCWRTRDASRTASGQCLAPDGHDP